MTKETKKAKATAKSKEMRKPEDMVWYDWECILTEAITAKFIGAITEEEYERFNTLTNKVSTIGKFTLELREEACQLEAELEKHRDELQVYYDKLQDEFLKS